MSRGRAVKWGVMKWGTVAATIYSLFYFRGDIQRYVKMKRM
jgi:hypothetical protein